MNNLVLAPTTIPHAAPLEYVEAAAAAGYRQVGLRLNRSPGLPFQPVVGNARLIDEMKGALSSAGLTVLDIYSFYLEPDTDVAAFESAIELGAEFGAKYLVTMGADAEWSRMRDNFVRICEIAAGYGLVCILEPAVIRPLASFAQAQRLIREFWMRQRSDLRRSAEFLEGRRQRLGSAADRSQALALCPDLRRHYRAGRTESRVARAHGAQPALSAGPRNGAARRHSGCPACRVAAEHRASAAKRSRDRGGAMGKAGSGGRATLP